MATLTILPLDIKIEIMYRLASPATLAALLSALPQMRASFLTYFRLIVQSVLLNAFPEGYLLESFLTILAAHFINPMQDPAWGLEEFLIKFVRCKQLEYNSKLPECVPHSMESLEYMVSIELALIYFRPCAEDGLEPCYFTDYEKFYDDIIVCSKQALMRIQLEAELFHRMPESARQPSDIDYYWSNCECPVYSRRIMTTMAFCMHQLLYGEESVRRSSVELEDHVCRYVRVVDVKPPGGPEHVGLPQLHLAVERVPCTAAGMQYIRWFAKHKQRWIRDLYIRRPPRARSEPVG